MLRAKYVCDRSDSSMWCREAAAYSAVLPSDNRKVTKDNNTEKGDAAKRCDVCRQRYVNGKGRDVSSHTT